MLVAEPMPEKPTVVVVAEDNDVINDAIGAVAYLRRSGVVADAVTTGSPRKRFDKAARLGANVIVVYRLQDGRPQVTTKGDELTQYIQDLLVAHLLT